MITAFSDQKFQSSVALPTLSIDKVNFDWVVQLSIDNKQIQKKYKHAPDFGISGNFNQKNAQLFKDKIIEHMKEPSTQIIEGTFKKIEVTHYFNPETGLNVFFNRDNNKFISGWLLKDDQLDNMVNRGGL